MNDEVIELLSDDDDADVNHENTKNNEDQFLTTKSMMTTGQISEVVVELNKLDYSHQQHEGNNDRTYLVFPSYFFDFVNCDGTVDMESINKLLPASNRTGLDSINQFSGILLHIARVGPHFILLITDIEVGTTRTINPSAGNTQYRVKEEIVNKWAKAMFENFGNEPQHTGRPQRTTKKPSSTQQDDTSCGHRVLLYARELIQHGRVKNLHYSFNTYYSANKCRTEVNEFMRSNHAE